VLRAPRVARKFHWHGFCTTSFEFRPRDGVVDVESSGRVRKEADMPLINVVMTLIVVGVLLWLVNRYIPMDGKIKSLLNIVVVVAVVLWLLNAFGLMGNLGNVRVGRG
jgi:hypothetical protein